MTHWLVRVLEVVAVLGACSGIGYYALCVWSAARFLRARNKATEVGEDTHATRSMPPVSILKPLRGTDPGIYESFRSHCRQDYPEYEIIFGVSEPDDPAIELVERLKREFPERSIRLLVCPQVLGTNVKVSNLAQMLPLAKCEYLVVNDSDIRVEPDYLRRVLAPLADEKVGMVTCLYRGTPAASLGSRLESLGISTDFSGAVLLAKEVEGGVRFGLGSTMVFRRRELEAIGGFEALLDYLADDYELGARISAQGLQVKLANVAVETLLPPYSLGRFVDHQLRWARSVRDSRPWGYFGLGLTFGLPWAFLALLLARGTVWGWVLLAITLAMRLSMALVIGRRVLRDRHVIPLLWLVPLRDVVALFVWIGSYTGHTIHWRGGYFRLKDGKLLRIGV